MLTRKTPDTLAAELTITGQLQPPIKFAITYFNRKQSEVEEMVKSDPNPEVGVASTILFVVKEWDSEYPLSAEGIAEMEDDRPGITIAIIQGFHDARRVTKVKN